MVLQTSESGEQKTAYLIRVATYGGMMPHLFMRVASMGGNAVPCAAQMRPVQRTSNYASTTVTKLDYLEGYCAIGAIFVKATSRVNGGTPGA